MTNEDELLIQVAKLVQKNDDLIAKIRVLQNNFAMFNAQLNSLTNPDPPITYEHSGRNVERKG